MHQVPIEEAPKHVQALISEAIAGEEVVFMRGPVPLVKLVPVKTSIHIGGRSEELERKAFVRELGGKYAFTKTSSEAFARRKKEEIELEEHIRRNRES